MDQQDIDRIRRPDFALVRRGYDQREVDKFLAALADWLEQGAQDEAGTYAVKRKLERAGETTARVLATAEEESAGMRREAEEDAKATTARAEEQARATTTAAKDKAKRTVDEGNERRIALEVVIKDLVARRDEVIVGIERLRADLDSATQAHKPRPGADSFAKPKVLDPQERREVASVKQD